jgi:hypothetical protein
MEIKLALAKILKKYDVFPANAESKNPVIREGIFNIRRPKYGLHVVFKPRD